MTLLPKFTYTRFQTAYHCPVFRHWLKLFLLAAIAFSLSRPANVRATLGATFTVNSAADTNNPADGLLTLREAILISNGARAIGASEAGQVMGTPGGGLDNIVFALGAGTPTINIGSGGLGALPVITNPVFINGNTGGATRVELNGAGAGGGSGLTISAGNSQVKSLVINRFTNASVNASGIVLQTGGNNTVEDCYLGTNAAGTAALGNSQGLFILNGSSNNLIGGTTNGARNLISGNVATGIYICCNGGGNRVEGNYVGTDVTGTADLGNGQQGVHVDGIGSTNNIFGGTAAAARNTISGNEQNGMLFSGGANGNRIEGNYIGTNETGTAALANRAGVVIISAPNNVVGGTTSGARNIISGNTFEGIYIQGSAQGLGTQGTLVQGNYIGTDVNGAADLGNNGAGIRITYAASVTIGGTASGARNIISGNQSRGILIDGPPASQNTISGNYIGTDATGTAALGNEDDGISIFSPSNTVGGTASDAGNLISGGKRFGIGIYGATATGNQVQGNLIGAKTGGSAALGNSGYGIWILDASNNVVGGTSVTARNMISGNGNSGILIDQRDSPSDGNQVLGNFIGVDVNGTAALANNGSGVQVNKATNTLIGGNAMGSRNIISGNAGIGVLITGGATGARVAGNYIGTNSTGTAALGNLRGVGIRDSSNNTIGGTSSGERNIISGNQQNGVDFFNVSETATGNVVQGNFIGTDVTGMSGIGNGGYGVLFRATNNTVGGTLSGEGNVIAFNLQNGVGAIAGSGENVTGNSILSNSIFSNGGASVGALGIELIPCAAACSTGVTANDSGDADTGPNNLQNFPVLTAANATSTGVLINGTLNSLANTSFILEFFSNPACDPLGYGEGANFVGRTTVTTDGGGNVSFSQNLPVIVPTGNVITATATRLNGNTPTDTSEFSQCQVVVRIPSSDLQVTAAAAPNTVTTDNNFNLDWTLKNLGDMRANAPWVDRVLLSTDNQLGNDVTIADFPLDQSLDPNQTADRRQSINIPRAAIPANGNYFLIILTDANNNVTEEFGENNNWRVIPISVTRRPLPDLIVQSIEAPNTAFFDQTITVRWTVKNMGAGPTDAAEWSDWIYLSTDDIPEVEDPFRVVVQNASYLNAGDSYVASVDIRIPRGVVGTYNVLVYTDFASGFFSGNLPYSVHEENEGNNRKVKSITVSAPPLPDLQVAFANGPEQAFTGQAMLIDWRVENRDFGTRPDQTGWTDSFYLSKDTVLNTAQDRLIGSRRREGGLAQNEGYTVNSFSVTLPNNIAGDWYLFVVTDSGNEIFEFGNEGNNSKHDAQLIHIIATPPEMIVQSFTAPATGTAQRSVTVNWTIRNQGAFDAPASWFDTVYLSSDATLDPAADAPLATVGHSSTLGPGLTYSASAEVTLPACGAGTFYLFVFTDSRDQLFEFDPGYDAEANNYSPARAIQITAIPPDLRVTAATNATTANAGQPFSVSWTVTNQGAGATLETAWTDRIYLSETPTLNLSTALLVADYQHDGALAQNASYSRTENPITPTRAQGLYYLFVVTDANDAVEECANDGNNSIASAATLNINNDLPDLIVTGVSAPGTALSGQTISVSWTGKNMGTAAAQNSAWNDRVYLSSDSILNDGDRQLATRLINGPLAINATYAGQAQVTIPVVAAGAYFIIVAADAENYVFEGRREDNNANSQPIQVQTPDVDLRVTAVDAPAQAFSGTDVTVTWTVNNFGSAQTLAAQWTDNVIISRDQILDATDQTIGYLVHDGALAGGASYNATLSVELPSGLSGPYSLFVRTDVHNATAETNENNNSGYEAITLQIPPPVDLAVTTINIPLGGTPGEPTTISWVVKNQSDNTAIGRWTDAVYLSQDQLWDIGDAEIGRTDKTGPLAAGEMYTGALTMKIPAVSPGNYFVIVRADVRNRVREDNEANNRLASTNTMVIDVPELMLGVPANGTLETGQERFYKVAAPGNETLRVSLDGQNPLTANELFARFGLLPSRSAFDFSFSRPYEPDQEIVVPETQAGAYYSLARGALVPNGTDPFSIKAEIVPFSITAVSPNRVGDNGQVTITIRGAKFKNGATVKLMQGSTTLTAATVWLVDSATVKARFFFTDAPQGAYNVVLTNPDGQTTAMTQAVAIETAVQLLVDLSITGDTRPRIGRLMVTEGLLSNVGNIDIPYTTVFVEFAGEVNMSILRPPVALPRLSDFPYIDWENTSLSVSQLDGITADDFTVRDLEPGQRVSFTLRIRGFSPDPTAVEINASAMTKEQFLEELQTVAEIARQEVLKNPGATLPPDLASSVHSTTEWWAAIANLYAALGYLDTDMAVQNFSSRASQRARELLAQVDLQPVELCLLEKIRCIERAREDFEDCGLLNILDPKKLAGCNAQFINRLRRCQRKFERCKKTKEFCDVKCQKKRCREAGGVPKLNCKIEFVEDPVEGIVKVGKTCTVECLVPVFSSDPNDKVVASGFGVQSFISGNLDLPYTVNFENVASATAAAHRVHINDQLDPNLDWRTFRLKEIGFGSYRIPIPDNRAFFQGRVQLGPDLGNVLADISAGIDIATGQVFWTLTAIDPMTGEQPNSAAFGLLPPNDATGRGQGYVTYTVQPKAGLPTGTQITNKASIIFDTNEPIVTNTVSNTLDADAPTSAVNDLPPSSPPTFALSWSGDDPAGGSGVQSYDIWVSDNGGPYQPFLTGTTDTSAQFTGQVGRTYRFYSIARDNAGNVEAAPNDPDAVTTIGAVINPAPVLTGISPDKANAGGAQFTLTVNGANFVAGSVVNWNGSPRATVLDSATQLTATITAADIANAGTAQITVVNPPPGGGLSNAATFTINALPVITPAPGLARQQGSAGVFAPIAMVSDAETAAGNLLVNVTAAPPGITITNLTNTNGAITANITVDCGAVVGANPVALTVTDGAGATATANFVVNVAANTPPLLVYGSPQNVSVNGANAFSPLGGPADNGAIVSLVLQSVTPSFSGNISVNPAGVVSVSNAPSGSYTVTVRATDNCGAATNAQFTLTVGADCPTVTLAPASLVHGTAGIAYNQTFSVSSGGTYSFSVTNGALPPGLSLSATGVLTGTPAQAGSYNFRITAANGSCSGARDYTLVIGCAAVTLAPESLPNAAVGVNYSQTITATPAGAYSFSISSGSLPSGLLLNPQTGLLSGAPTAVGTYSFTIRAQNSGGCSGTRSYTLVVACPTVTISPATLPSGAIGANYSQTLSVTPPGGNYTYAVTSGVLPNGLTLNPATGFLSGQLTAGGAFTFTIRATGANGCSGVQTYSITVGSSCTITLPELPNGTIGTLYNRSVAASPQGNYSYSVTAGNLPTGLTLYDFFGLVFGYPTAAGTYNFTIKAMAGNCMVQRDYSVTIGLGFSPPALRDATVGLAYNQSFTPLGATGAASFSLASGALPQGLSLTADGRITGTPAQGGLFPVKVRLADQSGMTGAQEIALKVNAASAPVLNASIGDPLACTRGGSTINGSATITNNDASTQPATLVVTLPPELPALNGSCTASLGQCNVESAAKISWRGTLNAGQTATIGYRAQIVDGIATGAQLCATATAEFAGGATATAPACLTLNCPVIGPGLPPPVGAVVSDQKAGSVLVYNLYTSSTDPNRQNTRINLTNTDTARPAYMHLFFVDGATCSVADSYVCLTPNQTMSFLASDLDPGTTGFIVAVAVDQSGCPTSFNHFIGDAYVKLASGHAANLGAQAITSIAGGLPACDQNSSTATLSFDGISYGRLPRVLALDNIASRADGNDTLLVLNRINGNLGTGTSPLNPIFGILFNDIETSLSFSFNPGVCQFRSVISNNFPRTAPRFEQFIAAGRSGWLKLWSDPDAAILGAALNFNASAGGNAGAFTQGHNLHALTLTNAASLLIPVFPPSC